MSFAELLRAELSEIVVKQPCCRRAVIAGLLLCSREEETSRVSLQCRNETTARLAAELLEKGYGKQPEHTVVGSHGHMYHTLSVSSVACVRLARQLRDPSAELDAVLHLSACDGCRSAFLRGAFLSCGTVTDPKKASHLEFLLPETVPDEPFARLLEGCGYPPHRIVRKDGTGLYYKDSSSVGDLLTLMGAQHIIFDLYNMGIEREIRNDANRATNCVARNIEKSIAAAGRQTEAIERLMKTGKLETLSEPLRETARLRYRHPDATLDELRNLHTPPISKSGLNHRLQKLMSAAERQGE